MSTRPSTLIQGIAVNRIKPDGTPDTRFNGKGFVTFGYGSSVPTDAFGTPAQIAIQPDGRVFLGSESGSDTLILVRLNADGTTDTTFGDGGQVKVTVEAATTGVAAANARDPVRFAALRVLADGTILVGGIGRPRLYGAADLSYPVPAAVTLTPTTGWTA